MAIKVYGSAMSTSRVLTTLIEKELPYEFILIDISKGDQNRDEYKKMQPFGKVPVLQDGDLVVFESRAICRYLASAYTTGTALMPSTGDIKAYALFEQAVSIEQSYFAAAAEKIGTETVIRPKKGLGDTDPARVAEAEAELNEALAVYEEILGKQKFLAGDELTLADLFHLPNGAALMAFGWKHIFERYPNVNRWFMSLRKRESWIKAAGQAGTLP